MKLHTIENIRNELAKLYRMAKKNIGDELTPQAATKLAYLLNCIGRSLEGVELEQRISKLEERYETSLTKEN